MARSTYIYYFQERPFGEVRGAFTVKWEALQYAEIHHLSPADFILWRIRDGRDSMPEPTKEFNLIPQGN